MNWRYWLSWIVPVRMETRYRTGLVRWQAVWWQWQGRVYRAQHWQTGQA